MYDTVHAAALWSIKRLGVLLQKPGFQKKGALPDYHRMTACMQHLCTAIGGKAVLFAACQYNGNTTGKNSWANWYVCNSQSDTVLVLIALRPYIPARKGPAAVALYITCTVVKYIFFPVNCNASVYPVVQADYAVPALQRRHKAKHTHNIIVWRRASAIT